MKLSFFGAAETVTGSCYLLQDEGFSLLVDCGMFQGHDVQDRNHEPFEFIAKDIDAVILTHAHMDHCGLLPKLVREGYNGPIYMTPPSAALAELVVLDSAKIQELEARRESKHNHAYSEAMPYELPGILYDTKDALKTVTLFRTQLFNKEFEVVEGVKCRFVQAGHILGAASAQITIGDKRLLFSGDIGRTDQTVIESFADTNDFAPDYVVMESLYGGVAHPDRNNTLEQLLAIINDTTTSDGNVIIPCFAIHRTQEILEMLAIAFRGGLIKDDVQVYIDSPMASRATRIYTQFSSYFNEGTDHFGLNTEYSEVNERIAAGTALSSKNRFSFDELRYVRTHKKSLKLGSARKSIILAGSGMVEGGRIMHHIASHGKKSNNSIVFVGYQAEQTLGREIVDGAKEVTINKQQVELKARVHYLRGFSAHADSPTLEQWLKSYDLSGLRNTFLVHADPERSEAFAEVLELSKLPSHIPAWKEDITLYA